MTRSPAAAPDLHRPLIAAEPDPAAPVVLARAQWPDGPDDTLTPIAGFIISSYSPLVAEVAERCLRARHGQPPADPELGGRTGVVLASVHGDVGTAEEIADAVRTGRRVQPLLFFQSNPNAVLGHLAARWGLAGPVVCTSPTGADPLQDALAVAALMLDGGDAAEVLVIVADQAAERGGTEPGGTERGDAGGGGTERGGTTGGGADQAVALLVGPRVGLPALPLPYQPGPKAASPARPAETGQHGEGNP